MFNSSELEHERLCLLGTRAKILQLVEQWSTNPRGECIFWLSGMAGTGKSTIARTLSRTFLEKNQLGASFFVSRGGGDRGSASKLLTSIAYQLALGATNDGILAQLIRKAVKEYPKIAKSAKRDQWRHLIDEPLSKLDDQNTKRKFLVFIIDASDECEDDRDIKLILTILAEVKNHRHIQLRIFVTSRPHISVIDGFRRNLEGAYQSLVLHEIERYPVEQDICIFLSMSLSRFKSRVL